MSKTAMEYREHMNMLYITDYADSELTFINEDVAG